MVVATTGKNWTGWYVRPPQFHEVVGFIPVSSWNQHQPFFPIPCVLCLPTVGTAIDRVPRDSDYEGVAGKCHRSNVPAGRRAGGVWLGSSDEPRGEFNPMSFGPNVGPV